MGSYIAKSKCDDWATPKFLYNDYMNLGYFDPCPLFASFDGLNIDWENKNFVNPPYSQLKKWIIKAIEENKKKKDVILLIPSRTDTKAFELLYKHGCDFCFIIGRLHFNEGNSAPFPSVLVTLRGDQKNTINYRSYKK